MAADPPVRAREGASPQGGNAAGAGAADRAENLSGAALARGSDRSRRRRKKFTFPASVRVGDRDPSSVVLVELKVGEIDAAYEVASGNRNRLTQELAKLSVHKVDGRLVSLEDMEAAWPTWSQKVRMQCVVAYNTMHNTSDEEDRAFLASAADDDE